MTKADSPDPGRVVDARPGSPEGKGKGGPEPVDGADPDDEVVEAEAEASSDDDDDDDEVAEVAEVAEVDEDEDEEEHEALEADLFAVLATELAAERDDYLDQLRRLQADFENYRKRVLKQQEATAERATEGLVADLLPVLDACDAAAQHGDDAAGPIAKALAEVLEKQGLVKLAPEGETFDPNHHEAVAHEPGDGESVVTEVLRPGYVWKGRVLRPAMVRVRG
jgi:molecular chaperone GrpE